MNKLHRTLTCGLLALGVLSSNVGAAAPAESLCQTGGVSYLFFNGTQTTKEMAELALQDLRLAHGATTAQGEAVRYEAFYNQSHNFDDVVGTFEEALQAQQAMLQGRFELFFSSLKGSGSWWTAIADAVPAARSIASAMLEQVKPAAVKSLTTLVTNPPTQLVSQEQRSRLETVILEGRKVLLIGHSQGNVFVNVAYDFAVTKASANSVKVVHIAPVTATLKGDHTLADKDLVSSAMRQVGGVANNTDTIPAYADRDGGVANDRDALGHGLREIYLNPKLSTSSHVKAQVDAAINSLIAPMAVASSGFFTATLTWDGQGDVDLHAYEPNGKHVYYGAPAGTSGHLDLDNMTANGPEHYFATCGTNSLQVGTYKIGLANYSRAQGRTATIQIASWADGVLGTQSITLAAATGDTPSAMLFDVVVTKSDNGVYSVRLAQGSEVVDGVRYTAANFRAGYQLQGVQGSVVFYTHNLLNSTGSALEIESYSINGTTISDARTTWAAGQDMSFAGPPASTTASRWTLGVKLTNGQTISYTTGGALSVN